VRQPCISPAAAGWPAWPAAAQWRTVCAAAHAAAGRSPGWDDTHTHTHTYTHTHNLAQHPPYAHAAPRPRRMKRTCFMMFSRSRSRLCSSSILSSSSSCAPAMAALADAGRARLGVAVQLCVSTERKKENAQREGEHTQDTHSATMRRRRGTETARRPYQELSESTQKCRI
jgi:hypothetical protein